MDSNTNKAATEWVKDIQQDADKALKAIYLLYRTPFENWIAGKFSINSDDVKDIYQDSILAFYENVRNDKFKGDKCSVKTYLFAIGKNIALNYLKKTRQSKEQLGTQGDDTEKYLDQKSLLHFLEQNQLEAHNERTVFILKQLNNLKNPCKDLITLYYFQKCSMKEIAKLLNYSNATVAKAQKYRCMAKLLNYFKSK